MKATNHGRTWWVALLAIGLGSQVMAQSTNSSAETPQRAESAPQRFDESAFRIVPQRNIFNANRSGGGQVRGPSRRPSSVEYFCLVGTMDYEKGTFAFFEGSSSQFTKVMKPSEVIAGHKLVEISADGVKLEADSKKIELPVGSQMRREDEGAWQVAEARGGFSAVSSGNGSDSGREGRSDHGDSSSRSRRDDSTYRRNENSQSSNRSSTSTTPAGANEEEVLKRLMERREKESQ
jgi:hypothetical protein